MPRTTHLAILRELLGGSLTAQAAATALLAIDSAGASGLAVATGVFTTQEMASLDRLMPAVRWEMAKRMAAKPFPDVPYDSPEYRAFMASVPVVRVDSDGPAG